MMSFINQQERYHNPKVAGSSPASATTVPHDKSTNVRAAIAAAACGVTRAVAHRAPAHDRGKEPVGGVQLGWQAPLTLLTCAAVFVLDPAKAKKVESAPLEGVKARDEPATESQPAAWPRPRAGCPAFPRDWSSISPRAAYPTRPEYRSPTCSEAGRLAQDRKALPP